MRREWSIYGSFITIWNTGTIRNCQKALYTINKEVLMLKEDEEDDQMEEN